MAREYKRADRLSDYLRRELAQLLQSGMADSRMKMVSITDVDLGRDLRHATVFYTALGRDDPEAAQEMTRILNRAAGFMHARLSEQAGMRMVPRLRFEFDTSVGHGRHMEALIKQAVAADGTALKKEEPGR